MRRCALPCSFRYTFVAVNLSSPGALRLASASAIVPVTGHTYQPRKVGVGVKGVAISQQGVLGISDTLNGVEGMSGSGDGVSGDSKSGVGVRGSSSGDDGIVGTSSANQKSGVFGDNTDTTQVTFGVSGRSQSPLGAGVNGFSDVGYGGHFRGARAPLRLQPATTIGPPKAGNHQAGEFFVDGNGDLFYCRGGDTPSGDWFHIVLGLPVDP